MATIDDIGGPTDPANDPSVSAWAEAVRTYLLDLRSDLDAASTIPAGGSTGEVLAKASSTDYDTEWIAGTGLPGAWTSYTPTAAGVTPGNGSATGAYVKLGRVVFFRAQFVFGSTSAISGSQLLTLTLPEPAVADDVGHASGYFLDSGTARFMGAPRFYTDRVGLYYTDTTQGRMAVCTSTAPFTWASGDAFYIAGTYEAAA